MAAALITLAELELRVGHSLPGNLATQAAALLEDISAEVRSHANSLLDDVEPPNVPPLVVAVVAKVARRAMFNPNELSSESMDGHQWAASARSSIFVTEEERQRVRRAVGIVPGMVSVGLEGYLPLHGRHLNEDVIGAIANE